MKRDKHHSKRNNMINSPQTQSTKFVTFFSQCDNVVRNCWFSICPTQGSYSNKKSSSSLGWMGLNFQHNWWQHNTFFHAGLVRLLESTVHYTHGNGYKLTTNWQYSSGTFEEISVCYRLGKIIIKF